MPGLMTIGLPGFAGDSLVWDRKPPSHKLRSVTHFAVHYIVTQTCMICANGVFRTMEFIETSVFTRLIDTLLDAEQYRALQDALILRPEAGDFIQGTEGRGKRGGLRVIYYFKNDRGQS